MSTSTTEVQSILSTFQSEPHKYDGRSSEGKFVKRLNSYSHEYTVTTGNVSINETRYNYDTDTEFSVAVPYQAVHLVRRPSADFDLSSDVIETYLKGKLKYDWKCREGKQATLVVVNEALVWVRYGTWHWSYVDATVWTLGADGASLVTTVTLDAPSSTEGDIFKVINKGLGNKLFEVRQENIVNAQKDEEGDKRQALIAQAHADFKPSYYFERMKKNAEKFIAENESVSVNINDLARYDIVRNADDIAVRVVVHYLCQVFLSYVGKSEWEVSAPYSLDTQVGYDRLDTEPPAIIDERVAVAYAIATASHDAKHNASFGKAVDAFLELLRRYPR